MLALTFVALGLALGVQSDGERRVAIQRTLTKLEIRDDARHSRVVLRLARGCTLIGLSPGGVVFLGCGDAYQTIDLRTGERDVYPLPVPEDSDQTVRYEAAGRYWLTREASAYHYDRTDYVQRFTGEVRTVDGRGVYADVDSPGLVRPLCRPVHRFRETFDVPGGVWETAVSGGRAVVLGGYRLWRCGDPHPQPIPGGAVTAGGGWATWPGVALRLRDLRRFRLPPGDVVHTRRAVYVLRAGGLRRARL